MMKMKKLGICLLLALVVCLGGKATAQASSGRIQMSVLNPTVQKGDMFTVVCKVTSDEEFLDTEFKLSYDSEVVTFLEGGSKVSGDSGLLVISSTGNEETVTKKTFALQFAADQMGSVAFEIEGSPKITDADGNGFSVISNSLRVSIAKKTKKKKQDKKQDKTDQNAEKEEPKPSDPPAATMQPADVTPNADITLPDVSEQDSSMASTESLLPSASPVSDPAKNTSDSLPNSIFLVMIVGLIVIMFIIFAVLIRNTRPGRDS
ncbi:MAG: hypothetical protein MRZ36_07120 [Eubacterium sp.]|nr:hypothetical protein [Eubacterium sp.]